MAQQLQRAAAMAGLEVAPGPGPLTADVHHQGPVTAVAPLIAAALRRLPQDLQGDGLQYLSPVGRHGCHAHPPAQPQ